MLARLWVGFLVGAFLSGAATPRYGAWVLLAPALILAALAAFDRPRRLLRLKAKHLPPPTKAQLRYPSESESGSKTS